MALPDIANLLPFRRALDGVTAVQGPAAIQVCGGPPQDVRRLVAVAGSFNPPHAAHFALLDAGTAAARANGGAFVLSVRTVDKEQPTGMLLEDRLWLLCRSLQDSASAGPGSASGAKVAAGAAGQTAAGAVVTNRGLYVDQAAALRGLCPHLEDLVFVVGYDKIVQIFDPRYYVDRDRALANLFAQAHFLVAPRDSFTEGDLVTLLADPANRPYAAGVAPLPIDPALANVSSSAIRAAVGSGAPGIEKLPDLVRQFITESGCYGADGATYARRAAALEWSS